MKAVALLTAVAIVVVAIIAWSHFHGRSHQAADTPPSIKQAQPASQQAKPTDATETDNFRNWTTLREAYRYYQFRLAADGSLLDGKQTFHLFAIRMPARSQICTYRDGERWACGQQAYIALLNFIGSAPLGCRPEDTGKPAIVICRLIDKDVSAWMLANGWAYLEKGVSERLYVNAAATGYYAKAGVWAERPH